MNDDGSDLIPIDVEDVPLAALRRRSPLVASIGVVLLCALTTPLPFMVRTGSFGFMTESGVAIIPDAVFAAFLTSVLVTGAASFGILYGRRTPLWVFLLAAVAPLAVACVGAYAIGIASVPFTEVRADSEAYRQAAASGPFVLAAGAAASGAVFALVALLSFLHAAVVTTPEVPVARFHFGTFVLSLVVAGFAVFLYRPGERNFHSDIGFPDSLKTAICFVFVGIGCLAPFTTARLGRYAFLDVEPRRRLRAEAMLLPIGACGFSFVAVVLGIEESRWHAVVRWQVMNQHRVGSPFWIADAAVLVGLAALATMSSFLFVRQTEERRLQLSTSFWLPLAALVGVVASTVALDAAFGGREMKGLVVQLGDAPPRE